MSSGQQAVRPNSHGSPGHRCTSCGEDNVKSAAEKKARLAKTRRNDRTADTAVRGKVAFKAKVIGGGRIGNEDTDKRSDVSHKKGAPAGKVVSFSVKSNFGKVRFGGGVPKGHYLYGRKGAGGNAHRPILGTSSPRVDTTPRPATVPCGLIITSPRKPNIKADKPAVEENLENENPSNGDEYQQEEEFPGEEDLFIPAKSIVGPQLNVHELNNDDLRFLFKYGVRLPDLSGISSGKQGQLALVHLDDQCQAPPPTPPPVSVDEHYLIHKHFLSQLPEARLMYNDQDLEDESLCDPHTTISELSLGVDKIGNTNNHSTMSVALREAHGVSQVGGKLMNSKDRAPTSFSRGSQNSVLSKLTAYSWRRKEDDSKLPQVTNDLFYRATHASAEARAHYNQSHAASSRFGLSKSAAANCGFCQKTRSVSDSDDASSDTTSTLSNGAFRTRQLVNRINELEGLKQSGGSTSQAAGSIRQAKTPTQRMRRSPPSRSSDEILYQQVKQSIDWLNVPKETQSHIHIMGRSLNAGSGKPGSRQARLTRALMAGKDNKSAQTYLEYVDNVRTALRTSSTSSTVSQSSASGAAQYRKSGGQTGSARSLGQTTDIIDSVFACNRPGSRPVTEYEEQELSASFADDSSANDGYSYGTGSPVVITSIPKRPLPPNPIMVNSMMLESRPPPNSPKEGVSSFEGFTKVGAGGKTIQVDLRNATQVS